MARYIKKIEKDEKFISSCLGIALEAEHRVKQNNCVDIYRDYFRYTDEVATLELATSILEVSQSLPRRRTSTQLSFWSWLTTLTPPPVGVAGRSARCPGHRTAAPASPWPTAARSS